MELHGSIVENLEHALASARRLQGRSVYSDTLTYWRDLIQEAKRMLQNASHAKSGSLEDVVAKLEAELAKREI